MKQKIMKIAGIAAAAAVLAGCNEINFSGLLSLTEAVTFSQENRALVTINPGQFQTKASLDQSGQKKQIKLEIKNAAAPTRVTISFDKNIAIGEHFSLAAAQIGQNFDLAGDMYTKVEKSQEYSDYESCTYQYPQTVCRSAKSSGSAEAGVAAAISRLGEPVSPQAVPEVPNPEFAGTDKAPYFGPGPGQQPICQTIWVTRPGRQPVRYYFETTNRDLTANFVQAGRTLGSYTGKSSETRKVYTYQGQCY